MNREVLHYHYMVENEKKNHYSKWNKNDKLEYNDQQ